MHAKSRTFPAPDHWCCTNRVCVRQSVPIASSIRIAPNAIAGLIPCRRRRGPIRRPKAIVKMPGCRGSRTLRPSADPAVRSGQVAYRNSNEQEADHGHDSLLHHRLHHVLICKYRFQSASSGHMCSRLQVAPWLRIRHRRIAAKASNFAQPREFQRRCREVKTLLWMRAQSTDAVPVDTPRASNRDEGGDCRKAQPG
jgi:hypothetical protein